MPKTELSLNAAAMVAMINAGLMPNQVQTWLRYIHYGLNPDYFSQPMQVKDAYSGLLPELLEPLFYYVHKRYGYKHKGHFLFMYQHVISMLITYCSLHTQKELLQWILDYNNSATPHS